MTSDSAHPFVAEVLEAWRTNHRINELLLENVTEEGLRCTLSKRGGRDVSRQFAHLHDVRTWQLQKRAPDLANDLVPFASKDSLPREVLVEALAASAGAVERFLAEAAAGAPKRRAFKKGLATTLAYFVAHESHHRGSILLTLKTSGHAVPKAAAYAIWDWDRR